MPTNVDRFFHEEGLQRDLQEISDAIEVLARHMGKKLPDGPEKSTGMRKLLEARDCFLRAADDLIEAETILIEEAQKLEDQ